MSSFGSFLGLALIRRSLIVAAVGALVGVGYTVYSLVRNSGRTAAHENSTSSLDDNESSKKTSPKKDDPEEMSSSDSGKYDIALKEDYELSEKDLLRSEMLSAQTDMTGVSLTSDPSNTLDDVASSILDSSSSVSSRKIEITHLPPVTENQEEDNSRQPEVRPSTSNLQTSVEEEADALKKLQQSENILPVSEIDTAENKEIEVIIEPEETISDDVTGSEVATAASECIFLSTTPLGASVVSSPRSERRRTLEDINSSVFDIDSVHERRSSVSKEADLGAEKEAKTDFGAEVADAADDKSESTTGSLLPSASSEMTTVLLHSSSESDVGSVEASEHNLSSDEVSSKILSEATDKSAERGNAESVLQDVSSGRDDLESQSEEFEHVFYEKLSESQEFSEKSDS